MKRLRKFLLVGCGLLCVLVGTELCLRLQQWWSLGPAEGAALEYKNLVNYRVSQHWLNVDQKDPFMPPYLVFADTRWDDHDRLARIAEATRLPADQSWTSHDFLQAEERDTQYIAHSNSLGFRDPPRTRAKPAGTKRIVALGSYQTFGHGVGDEQTYPAYLEKALGPGYEVWNGGRHAATAIVGLARMQSEIFDYQPDLLILDYGFVDVSTWSDDLMPEMMLLPDGAAMTPAKRLLRACNPLWGQSLLWQRTRQLMFAGKYAQNVANFQSTMRSMLALARQHHVPVVLVKQFPALMPTHAYSELVGPGVSFLNVRTVFRDAPPSEAERRAFAAGQNWSNELKDAGQFPYAPYQLDLWQLSPRGAEVLADALAAQVKRQLEP